MYSKTYPDGDKNYIFFTNLGKRWAGFSYPDLDSDSRLSYSDEYRDDQDRYWTTGYVEDFNLDFARRIIKTILSRMYF
jgi:hypothetical protein